MAGAAFALNRAALVVATLDKVLAVSTATAASRQ